MLFFYIILQRSNNCIKFIKIYIYLQNKQDKQSEKKTQKLMQGFQINHEVLNAIFFQQQKFKPQMVNQIIEWFRDLQPSVNMTQSIISAFILDEKNNKDQQESEQNAQQKQNIKENLQKINQRIKMAIKDVPKLLIKLHALKCPKNFLRAYLLFVKRHLNIVGPIIDRQYILEQWFNIPVQLLESYCETFSISIENYSTKKNTKLEQNKQNQLYISTQEFDKKIDFLIQKKEYSHCMTLIKMSNAQKSHVNKLLAKMTTNKQASKAADYIKTLKLNPNDYPALGQRLYKNTARHFLSKNGWQYAEQIFESHPQGLACVVQDLIYKKKYLQALSIWARHQNCRQFIIKEQALDYLKPYIQNGNVPAEKIKENFLHKDDFGPTNTQKYISLQELGIQEKDVIWINYEQEQLLRHLQQISSSQILGIDTESIVGQTKFDKSQNSKFQQAALIQIATRKNIYIFDGLTVKQHPVIKQALITYIKNNGLIVGHTLENDMQCLLKSLGCSDQQIRQLKNIKVVDVWKLFKSIYPEKKFSSLAFITQTMLGKQLCKDHTLSNWKRRPLRKNQLHYAALDAFIVIKIYEKFLAQFGQQMIEYYCSMESLTDL